MFLREMPAKIFMDLRSSKKPIYVTPLAKDTNCTYSHVIKILGVFDAFGLVKFQKTGRIKTVSLTKDGEEIADTVGVLTKKLVQIEESVAKAGPKEKKDTKKAGKK